MIQCDLSTAHLSLDEVDQLNRIKAIHEKLHHSDTPMCGWVDYPLTLDDSFFNELNALALDVRNRCQTFVICGIGGSYLGTRAGLEALLPPFENDRGGYGKPEILFAGQNLSSIYHQALLQHLEHRDVTVCVVSKSGVTMETHVVFSMLRKFLQEKYPDKWRQHIIAITDDKQGQLREDAEREGYRSLAIPHNIGGRYSVLTSVGLFPFAVAGLNIREIMAGAAEAARLYNNPNVADNPCYQYALARHLFHEKGYFMEVFEVFEGHLKFFLEWLCQLFAESECKDGKGLFPVGMEMSTDLHSLGQFLQDGRQNFFETVIGFKNIDCSLDLPNGAAGTCPFLGNLNRIIQDSVCAAHQVNKTPIINLIIDNTSLKAFGFTLYFFQKACAMSASLIGVNPFDQPGVEAYKKHVHYAIHHTDNCLQQSDS